MVLKQRSQPLIMHAWLLDVGKGSRLQQDTPYIVYSFFFASNYNLLDDDGALN